VFAAGNKTRDDQPCHVVLQQRVPRDVAELWVNMCPAQVYAITDEGKDEGKDDGKDTGGDGLVDVELEPSNCVECGAITAKGGRLTPPESPSGPEYSLT
jgi:electron-transferring-flavoprotein dehydrogenase